MGRITLNTLQVYAYHGCFAEENKIGAEYNLNIWVEGDFSKAEKTDSIIDTVDYVAIADIASNEMATPSKLIEHVAARILSKILSSWPEIKKSGLTIKKLAPPMNEYVQSVEYTIEKSQ
jgi:dihydroneopterin aldolase